MHICMYTCTHGNINICNCGSNTMAIHLLVKYHQNKMAVDVYADLEQQVLNDLKYDGHFHLSLDPILQHGMQCDLCDLAPRLHHLRGQVGGSLNQVSLHHHRQYGVDLLQRKEKGLDNQVEHGLVQQAYWDRGRGWVNS